MTLKRFNNENISCGTLGKHNKNWKMLNMLQFKSLGSVKKKKKKTFSERN